MMEENSAMSPRRMEDGKVTSERHLESGVYSFPDNNASCMGVDYSGTYALLAGRRLSTLVNLDNPQSTGRKFSSNHKWDPSGLEWNPHESMGTTFAVVVNQKVEIRDIIRCVGTPNYVLGGHTRVISDMNWQHHDPHLLLTCSMDTYIYLWDIREARRPFKTFTTVAGSSQVKWNKQNEYVFASAHDGDVRVWDIRKGNLPVAYIAGHLSKIHGIDWSPTKEHCFVTASNDSTVKFWNVTSPKQAKQSIHAGAPVWRARYAPFGDALVTLMVHQQVVRGENKLLLWNASETNSPVHTFVGHTDVILGFEWRSRVVKGYEENQLVTWSKDQTLRLWSVEPRILMACNGEIFKYDKDYFGSQQQQQPPSRRDSRNSLTSPRSPQTSLPGSLPDLDNTNNSLIEEAKDAGFENDSIQFLESPGFSLEETKLQQEFALLNVNNPIVTFEKIDAGERVCTVSAKVGSCNVKLQVTFPPKYPDSIAPVFRFLNETNIESGVRNRLIKSLHEVSGFHVKFNRPCLEPCLRQLVQQMEELTTKDEFFDNIVQPPPTPLSSLMLGNIDNNSYGSYQDPAVPFPRYSGARFCGADKLVVFCKPAHLHIGTPRNSEPSLRSMAALSAYMGNVGVNAPFESQPFGKDFHRAGKKMRSGAVHISDISGLLPIHFGLAKNYIFEGADVQEICNHNASVAKAAGRRDLVQTWSLMSLVLSRNLDQMSNTAHGAIPWAQHPFGKRMIGSLFDYYKKIGDMQTLAMLSCVLSEKFLSEQLQSKVSHARLVMPYTPSGGNFLRADRELMTGMQRSRVVQHDGYQPSPEFPYAVYVASGGNDSSSPPPCLISRRNSVEGMQVDTLKNCRLLDSVSNRQCDQHKKSYADLLYRWGLYIQRVEVLKFVNEPVEPHQGLDLYLRCSTCYNYQQKPQCSRCDLIIIQCAVCRLGVRGLLSFCEECKHGGHTLHYVEWFEKYELCPAGCGCQCLQKGTITT